ncbi:hypothetical protein [Streptomyces sp. NPDC059224]|uniref:hypothetical protein n=1 Tax=Streptomyces sp. NPDC059224 TaxID=3346775 RepID=UPI0036A1B2BA
MRDIPDATDPTVARGVVRHTWEISLDQLASESHMPARPFLRMLTLLGASIRSS